MGAILASPSTQAFPVGGLDAPTFTVIFPPVLVGLKTAEVDELNASV